MVLSIRCKESAHPETDRVILKSKVTDFKEIFDDLINAVQGISSS